MYSRLATMPYLKCTLMPASPTIICSTSHFMIILSSTFMIVHALDVFLDADQAHLNLTVSFLCGRQFCLLWFLLLRSLTVLFHLCYAVRYGDATLLGLMHFQHHVPKVDDYYSLLIDSLASFFRKTIAQGPR